MRRVSTYLPELHAAQRGAKHSPPQVVLVRHEYAIQRIPGNFNNVATEGVDDVDQV